MAEIIEPTVRAMAQAGTPFKGVLYAGLMIEDGAPKLIEYNVRFGDPECQVLMLRLNSDLLPALLATAEGRLDGVELEWSDDPALCVVMAAKGYPGAYAKGSEIKGLAEAAARDQACKSSMPAPSATATASSPMAAACSASPRGAATFARRKRAPMRRSTRSTGPAASAAATSAGAPFERVP